MGTILNMKKIIIFCLVLFSTPLIAGDYNYFQGIDEYDRQTGQKFYGITAIQKSALYISNICIFNIKSEQMKLVFPPEFTDKIVIFNYEVGYSVENNTYYVNSENLINEFGDTAIKLDYSKASQSLIIVSFNEKSKIYTLWFCSKHGDNLRKIATYDEKTSIDIIPDFHKVVLTKNENNSINIKAYGY